MNRRTFSFVTEPREEEYVALIRQGKVHCSSGLVVLRPQELLDVNARKVLSLLEPFTSGERIVGEWPGTRLLGDAALVKQFNLSAESCAVLEAQASGLFDWQHPSLPEDLCLLRSDGTPWLTNIAHEHQAYLSLSDDEQKALVTSRPRLWAILAPLEGD